MEITLNNYGGFQASVGFAGQIVDETPVVIQSLGNSGENSIDPGMAVTYGNSSNTCRLVTNASDTPIGIACLNLIKTADFIAGQSYQKNDIVCVMRFGSLWVKAVEAIDRVGENVVFIVGKGLGVNDDGAGTRVAIPGSSWDMVTANRSIGRIRLVQ